MSVGPLEVEPKVGEASESWSSGIWIFRNPKSKHPLPFDLFDGGLNVYLKAGERYSQSTRRKHVLRSMTYIC
jgi:hypothetical protein